jgi:UDP-N-acetylmuramate--alanine ligase
MSGIAEVFLNQGHQVTGSDLCASETTDHLKKLGARIFVGHSASNLGEVDVVIASTAITPDNPEITGAARRRIPIIPRAEMLGELMRGRHGFAISGTHGKTTTTNLLGHIFVEAGFDPTVVVGGKVESFGGHSKAGQSQWVIAEADESDGSFLHLPATDVIVTNIDSDHLDHFGDIAAIENAFVDFIRHIPFYGRATLCGDDPGVRRILPRLTKPYSTYGFLEQNDVLVRITHEDSSSRITRFDVARRIERGKTEILGSFVLPVLGVHNVLNAVGAISVASEHGIPPEEIARALLSFRHARRRFDVRYEDTKKEILVIDDYGHHPTEIRAVIETALKLKPKKLRVVFQPHRFTRTKNSWTEFTHAFAGSHELILLPIYAAQEDPISGVSSEELLSSLANPQKRQHFSTIEEVKNYLLDTLQDGDHLLVLGAGSITNLASDISNDLSGQQ